MNSKRILFILLILISNFNFAQVRIIKGFIKELQNDEKISFVSVYSKTTQRGTISDSSGYFELILSGVTIDTLEITSVGYKNVDIPLHFKTDSLFINILLEVAPVAEKAVVKVKYNRALWFWNRIIKNKDLHDKKKYDNYSYEVYNKLELDLNHVNKEKLESNKLLKPFNFILNNIDSSEHSPFLPLYITEAISDYYYQKNPSKIREVIKASLSKGLDNESLVKFMGNTYQNINVYNNFIPVFEKLFVSPFNDNADFYYNFKLLDTQYLKNKRLVHLQFTSKRKGENTFNGDCWIHDTTYAVQKITLRLSAEANINFIENLSLIQEYFLLNDSTWFLGKDKFVADIIPTSLSKAGFIGRKTTTYQNILTNSNRIINELAKNKKSEEIIILAESKSKPDSFWVESRHEKLNKNERAIYKMIDTIQTLPKFVQYKEAIKFIATGYKNIGNYQIGPWFNWMSGNAWEGTRIRFDLGTNKHFNKKIYLHSYLAYGFLDKKLKGQSEIFYLPEKNPRFYLYGSYTKDLDNGQQYYDEITTDNIFSFAVRKKEVPRKFQRVEEKRFEAFVENNIGFSLLFSAVSKQYTPLLNLPDKSNFATKNGEPLNTFETSIRLRFAYLEKFLENNFFRTSLGSTMPIVELKYTKGWSGVFNSSYSYSKINFSVTDNLIIPPYGKIHYNLFAGKVNSTLPFPLLEIHPGNDFHYYNKYAFNLMNRFEFISDQYAGFNFEHNIGNGLFKFIPITRKLKFRQFWNAKGVWGDLTDANKSLNFVSGHTFQSINKNMYLELGTGVDNILKILRLDLVWRVAPNSLSTPIARKFGVFGSFRINF